MKNFVLRAFQVLTGIGASAVAVNSTALVRAKKKDSISLKNVFGVIFSLGFFFVNFLGAKAFKQKSLK